MMVHTPLEGLRVVELGTHVAVPSSARLLAEYGADVIKVESPSSAMIGAAQV